MIQATALAHCTRIEGATPGLLFCLKADEASIYDFHLEGSPEGSSRQA